MAAARTLYEETAEACRELGDEHLLLLTNRSLAWACIALGDVEGGRAVHEENLQRARALGNRRIEAIVLGALSMTYVEEGRLEEAQPMLLESHRLHEELSDPLQTAFDLFRFAAFLTATDDAVAGAMVLAASEARAVDAGGDLMSWDSEAVVEMLERQREQLGDEAFTAARDGGRALTAAQGFRLALEHCGFAE
jgi:hypothetical protein